MGCDIHIFVEKKSGKYWQKVGAVFPYKYGEEGEKTDEPFDDRNYTLFAFLADVRNGYGFAGSDTGDAIKPIDMPRGVPKDASDEYLKEVEGWNGDGHSHSWFTLGELKAANWDMDVIIRGIVPSDVYEYLKEIKQNPERYSSGIFGNGIKTVSEKEWENMDFETQTNGTRWHVKMEWKDKLRTLCDSFINTTIPALEKLGSDDEVRIVFFFDN